MFLFYGYDVWCEFVSVEVHWFSAVNWWLAFEAVASVELAAVDAEPLDEPVHLVAFSCSTS